MTVHRRYFENFWVPWCVCEKVDPWTYSSTNLINCLEFNMERLEGLAASEKRPPQHGALKTLRAAVSESWKIVHGSRVSQESDVADYFVALRRDCPLRRGYTVTWDVNILFDFYRQMAAAGLHNGSMPLNDLRDKALVLSKLKGARSSDLTKIFFRWSDQSDALHPAGLFGSEGRLAQGGNPLQTQTRAGGFVSCQIESWRYFIPKNVNSLEDVFSPWIPLGPQASGADVHICCRSAVQAYVNRTAHLTRAEKDGHSRLFVSLVPTKLDDGAGVFTALSADRIGNLVGAVMLRAGVPAKFKKHSTRHAAGSAAAATPQGREDFLRTAQMSGPVFDKYYKCPIENRHDYSAPLQVPSLSLDD